MNRFNTMALAGAMLAGLICATTPVLAEAGSNPLANAKGSRIVGVYDVSIDVHNCVSGAYLFSMVAMHKFELGGTGQLLPSGNSAVVPVHMMVWEYLGDDTWRSATQFFRYDAGGVIGTGRIVNEVWLSEDGTEYGGSGYSENYDLAGNLVGVGACPSFTGTRFTGG